MTRLYVEEVNALRTRREEILSELHWNSGRYSQPDRDRMADELSALRKILSMYPEDKDKPW